MCLIGLVSMSMQWLLNMRVCQNHLESLFQHRFLGSISRFSELAGQGWGLTVYLSSPYPDDTAVESKLLDFRSWRSQSFVSCFRTVPREWAALVHLVADHLPTLPPGMAEALNVLNPLGTQMHAPQALTGAGFQEHSFCQTGTWHWLSLLCPSELKGSVCTGDSEIRKWKLREISCLHRGKA